MWSYDLVPDRTRESLRVRLNFDSVQAKPRLHSVSPKASKIFALTRFCTSNIRPAIPDEVSFNNMTTFYAALYDRQSLPSLTATTDSLNSWGTTTTAAEVP